MFCQTGWAIIFIGLAFVSQHYIESWRTDESVWAKAFRLVPFVTAPIGLVILLNLLFVLAKTLGLTAVSDLDYKDTMLLVASVMGPVGVAFFQERVRSSVEAASERKSKNDKEFDKRRREEDRKWHENERREEFLRHLAASLPSCSGYGVNYAVPNARIAYGTQFDEKWHYLLVVEAATDDLCFFYYPHLTLLEEDQRVELDVNGSSKYAELHGTSWSLEPNRLVLRFDEQVLSEHLQCFFMNPAADWDVCKAKNKPKKLEFRVHLAVERQFEGYGAEKDEIQPGEEGPWLRYYVQFSVSARSGYDAKGQFLLDVSDGYIGLETSRVQRGIG